MPATARRPIDFESHRGSSWSMHIRDGLIDAKHRASMGEAIWLYLYLHKECAAKTGLVKLYKHHEAAVALGLTRRGVMLQMDRLERKGYVTVTRGQHGLSVQITRYEWQARRSGPDADVHAGSPLGSPDVQSSSHQSVSDVQSSSHQDLLQMCSPVPPDVNSSSPILLNTSSYNGVRTSTSVEVGVSAPAVDAQEETPTALAQDDERQHRARALCVELRIPPTDAALKAMANVVKDHSATTARSLEDLAVDAADWLERHKKRQRTVAFFRNWVQREAAGPPTSAQTATATVQQPERVRGEDGIVRDAQGRPVWLPERRDIVDHTWPAQKRAFMRHWGDSPEFLPAETRKEAGIPDSVPWYPDMIKT